MKADYTVLILPCLPAKMADLMKGTLKKVQYIMMILGRWCLRMNNPTPRLHLEACKMMISLYSKF